MTFEWSCLRCSAAATQALIGPVPVILCDLCAKDWIRHCQEKHPAQTFRVTRIEPVEKITAAFDASTKGLTAHDHAEYVPGCYWCALSRAEVAEASPDLGTAGDAAAVSSAALAEMIREYTEAGDGG